MQTHVVEMQALNTQLLGCEVGEFGRKRGIVRIETGGFQPAMIAALLVVGI